MWESRLSIGGVSQSRLGSFIRRIPTTAKLTTTLPHAGSANPRTKVEASGGLQLPALSLGQRCPEAASWAMTNTLSFCPAPCSAVYLTLES